MTTIRTLELKGTDPARWGEQHGESFRDDVRAIAEIRMALTLSKTDLGTKENVLALARHHLPVLEKFDAALHAELVGIARGAKLTPEEIVVINHYTDLRDLRLADLARLNAGASAGATASEGTASAGAGATASEGTAGATASEGAGAGAGAGATLPGTRGARDLHSARGARGVGGTGEPDGCSALFTSEGKHRILGQTWDMHGSAEPYALLIKIPSVPPSPQTNAAGIPKLGSTLVFSITGCLGMTGMTSWGTALTINNLNSLDATIGVVWPATVRAALKQADARAMRDIIMNAPIGSGRHYVVADDKDVFGIETSGTKKKVIREGGRGPYFHTNHCVDDEMIPTARILPGSTTLQRYATLGELVKKRLPDSIDGVFNALEDVGLKQHPTNPHEVATCGALVMDISARNAKACVGIPGPDADSIVVELR